MKFTVISYLQTQRMLGDVEMLKKEDFKTGDEVKIVQITTTEIGVAVADIFIGNAGTVVDVVDRDVGYNELEVILDGAKETWFVSACDLEIV